MMNSSTRLKGLAYRMLGSLADAEDVLQEAALRLHTQTHKPDSEEAFLYTVVTRLCIDKLRKQKRERKHYFGPWLPDPLPDAQLDPAEVQHDLSVGLMCLLDELSPAERAGFVLREAFDFSYAEIAKLLGVSSANARQRVSRARARMQRLDPTRDARNPVVDAEQRDLLEQLIGCVGAGDAQGVVALMSEDAIAFTDGGGVVSAAIIPIREPQRIAQVLTFVSRKSAEEGEIDWQLQRMNGGWALIARQDGRIHSCSTIGVRAGKVWRVYIWRNPHKMQHLLDSL